MSPLHRLAGIVCLGLEPPRQAHGAQLGIGPTI